MNIVVLVKQVPDSGSERKLDPADNTVARASADNVINEMDEYAIEEALQVRDREGGEVTVLTVGPDSATDAIRKALSMGADKAVHLSDEALAGTDYVGTAKALAKALGTVEGGYDVVFAGNEASDGRGGAIPAMVAEVLGIPALTHAQEVSVEGTTVNVTRATDDGITKLTASLPAVVSVGEKINEPRYPSFKGIMAAKKKPVATISIADAGIDASEVGLANALSTVTSAAPKPPKSAGEKVEDEGDGGSKVAAFLVSQKLI